MKKLFYSFCLAMLMAFAGCSEAYDDQWILDKFEEMEKEHSDIQAQIDAQQTLLNALANKLTITAVTETENGYIVKFSDGSTATISDGKDGDSFIESIVVGEEDVTFTLADGTVIVIPLGSGSGEPSAEDNKIYYTTSDNTKLFPKTDASLYGAILISNTYKDGQGVLTFDDTITSIGEKAFYRCTSLTSVTIPDSITSIGEYAFDGCSSLTSVTIGNGVTSIGEYAFDGCSSLTSITIPDSVTSIGGAAFYGCTSLTSVTIPDSVTSIGYSAFWDCSSLTSVTIGNGVTSIGSYTFYGCTSLTSITIPESVTSIGERAFYVCSSLTSVTIGNGVTSIGSYAFYGCTSLTSITIPESVTEIGYEAFYDCTSLTSVYCKAVTPPAGELYMFDYNAPGLKIYVPRESVEAYKTAKYWFDYADNIEGYDFE